MIRPIRLDVGVLLILLCAVVLLALPITGCSKDETPEVKSGDPLAEYGDKLLDSYEHAGEMAAKVSLEAVRLTVRNFKVMNNRYPADLEELSKSMGDFDTSPYDYDPKTGTVTLKSK